MLTTTHSLRLVGTEGIPVLIETDIRAGIGIHLVGLCDAAVKETLLRTVTALNALNYYIPGKSITINIAPSEIVKSGSGYDLPIALTFIAASGQDGGKFEGLENWLILGELGLDGTVREVPGCVQAVETAIDNGFKGVIIPAGNAEEVAELFANMIPVYGVYHLNEAVDIVSGFSKPTVWEKYLNSPDVHEDRIDAWKLIKGQEGAKRAIEIAAAGGHHVVLAGEPGSGRGLLAKALLQLLPPMSINDCVEVGKAYSAAGRGASRADKVRERPFRAPHYSCSVRALLGGGAGEFIEPGEVTFANKGILYLDDFDLIPRSLQEGLRSALEDKSVTISRLKSKTALPADFQMVGAATLCPCGHFGHGDRCTCTKGQRFAKLQGIWNSYTYRFADIQAWSHPYDNLPQEQENENVEAVAQRVREARERQKQRYASESFKTNADLRKPLDLEKYCPLSEECKELTEDLITKLNLPVQSYSPMLRIARTIADLDGSDDICPKHLAEAASYRFIDRMGRDAEE